MSGASWIKPARVSALAAVFDDNRAPCISLTVREYKQGEADFVALAMKPGEARLTAGVFGTAPLYLVPVGAVLYASWDLAELHPRLRADRLVPRTVARTLTRQHRYTADTLFEGVYRLTERATAVFTSSGLVMQYPEPAEHVLAPRALRPDVDPLDARPGRRPSACLLTARRNRDCPVEGGQPA
ncbi:hypothetical protein AB0I77_11515 [Streptomyces sp. NPDC050619]|uniref:hypothetical protein n=1 Tax=Streptomyces sp. NPDC050619 TaxID=3157214 RepID=UPI00344AD748